MTFIESHQELARHPKTRKLARLLGMRVPEAIGTLHLLWWWCIDYAQHGDLSRYDAADIAEALMFEGEPDHLITALLDAGFLDREPQGLVIHDWGDYAGRLVAGREKNRERMQARRQAVPDVTAPDENDHHTTGTRAAHVQRTTPARVGLQYSTVPYSTVTTGRCANGEKNDGSDAPSARPPLADEKNHETTAPAAYTPAEAQAVYAALLQAMDREPGTDVEEGRWRKAAKTLAGARASPAEVLGRAHAFRREWPKVELTPTALAANWSKFANTTPQALDRRREEREAEEADLARRRKAAAAGIPRPAVIATGGEA